MMRVGLTGGFGTGKSTVARHFRKLGAHVIDADRLAHEALRPGVPEYQKILSCFGTVDRKKLAQIVFANPRKRKILESIIHPYVFRRIDELEKKKSGIVILEVPLLFETHFDKKMDSVVVVTASIQTQILRSSLSKDETRARIKAQMPLSQKMKRADFVIHNDGSLTETKKQTVAVWRSLLKK